MAETMSFVRKLKEKKEEQDYPMSVDETHSMWSENIKKVLKKMGLC